VLSDVKWRDFQEKELESDKWSEVKWGEDQLIAVKERELKWSGMWSVRKGSEVEWSVRKDSEVEWSVRKGSEVEWGVRKGSEVEWGVGLGEMCETECCTVRFTDCLLFRVVFNTDSSTLGSTRLWVLIVYNMYCGLFFVILSTQSCLGVLCVILCDVLLYCIVLYFFVAHCRRVHAYLQLIIIIIIIIIIIK